VLFGHRNQTSRFNNRDYKLAATAEDDAFMADLLGKVDTNVVLNHAPTRNIVKSEARRKVRVLSPPLSERHREKLHTRDENDLPRSPKKDQALHSDGLDQYSVPPLHCFTDWR
jgi:DNA polymerase alpha subunit A